MFATLCLVCQKLRIGWGVHYLLMDLCVGGGPLIKLIKLEIV
jgi:hypothetical protein